jgi:hypothetical protein
VNTSTFDRPAIREQIERERRSKAWHLAIRYSDANGTTEHPLFPRAEWKDEINTDQTLAGYWDWVVSRLNDAHFLITTREGA